MIPKIVDNVILKRITFKQLVISSARYQAKNSTDGEKTFNKIIKCFGLLIIFSVSFNFLNLSATRKKQYCYAYKLTSTCTVSTDKCYCVYRFTNMAQFTQTESEFHQQQYFISFSISKSQAKTPFTSFESHGGPPGLPPPTFPGFR